MLEKFVLSFLLILLADFVLGSFASFHGWYKKGLETVVLGLMVVGLAGLFICGFLFIWI